MFQIALYQPDIPGNTGTIMRTAACLAVPLHIIEPAGFDLSARSLKRAGMDYAATTNLTRHESWEIFEKWRQDNNLNLVLATTKGSQDYLDVTYSDNDMILFGRESSGVPDHVHNAADQRITISMAEGMRSLNLAVSVAMVTGEAKRQLTRR